MLHPIPFSLLLILSQMSNELFFYRKCVILNILLIYIYLFICSKFSEEFQLKKQMATAKIYSCAFQFVYLSPRIHDIFKLFCHAQTKKIVYHPYFFFDATMTIVVLVE